MPIGVVNQGTAQPVVLPARSVLPQFQPYPRPWYSHGSPNVAIPHSVSFIPPSVSNNSMQFPHPNNLLNAPFTGGHPASGTLPRNSSAVVTRPGPPMQNFQRPLNQQPPPAFPVMPAQATPIVPAVSPHVPVGSLPVARPTHLGPQPRSTTGGYLYNRPLTSPSGISSGLPAAPLPLRPSNMIPMVPPSSLPPQMPHPMVPQNIALPQPSTPTPPAANFTPRVSFPQQSPIVPHNFPSTPRVGQVPAPATVSSPAAAPLSTFLPARVPPPSPRPQSGPVPASSSPTIMGASVQVSAQAPVPTQSAPLSITRPTVPVPSLLSGQTSSLASLLVPSPQPIPAISGAALGSSPSFPPTLSKAGPVGIPPITSPKPQHPSPGDFTFQPHRPLVSASVTSPIPSSQPVPHTVSQVPFGVAQTPLNQNASQLPLAPPKAPSFRPAAQSSPIAVQTPGFPRPQSGQMGPPQGPLPPPPSASGSPFPVVRPRLPAFLNANTPPNAQADLRNFTSAVATVSSSIPSRPATLIQTHNQPPGHQPRGLVPPNQHLPSSLTSYVPGKPASTPGGSQIYDPFSPTSISSGPRQQEDDPAKARKPETDAEYEDLMASVGVR
uniref:Uncharacterized protein n=2 Tax=Anthurium amnicola TaxID=1678845 RepID=A0A1D1YNI3_9ARAE